MLIAGDKLKSAVQPNSAKVYHFDDEQGLSHEQVHLQFKNENKENKENIHSEL